MARKKLTELPVAPGLDLDDTFLVSRDGVSYRIEAIDLANALSPLPTNTPGFTELVMDIVGQNVDASIVYDDINNQFHRAALQGEVTANEGSNTLIINSGVVSNTKMAVMPALTIKGNNNPGTSSPVDLTASEVKALLGLDEVNNSELAPVPGLTLKGNNTGSSTTPTDLTTTQVKNMLALNLVDNTTDLNKPISTATQSALNTKLDASSYTASDVFTKVLTLDGSSSGLDSDLLDGQHGTYYTNAGNLGSGIVPDARMPAHTGDVTSTVGTVALTIGNQAVTLPKIVDVPALTLLGNNTGSAATLQALTAPQAKTLLGLTAVTNSDLADMSSGTVKGRVSLGTGDPEDLTGTQVNSLLPVFTAIDKGVVPAAVTATGTRALYDDGTFKPVLKSSSSVITASGQTSIAVVTAGTLLINGGAGGKKSSYNLTGDLPTGYGNYDTVNGWYDIADLGTCLIALCVHGIANTDGDYAVQLKGYSNRSNLVGSLAFTETTEYNNVKTPNPITRRLTRFIRSSDAIDVLQVFIKPLANENIELMKFNLDIVEY